MSQNAMELDTAVRHKLPLLCIITLNGGSTADLERNKPGRDPAPQSNPGFTFPLSCTLPRWVVSTAAKTPRACCTAYLTCSLA
jgi:hypothetical protein